MYERRFDSAPLARGARRDERGFLEVPALVTRTGVLTYRRSDGTTVRELRHPNDVFAPGSLATLRAAPVTVGHPSAGGVLTWIDADNAQGLEVGHCTDGQREGIFVAATLSLRRSDVIARVDSRELCEVSCGYSAEIVPEAGSYNGEHYTQRQTAITYNHVALLGPGQSRMRDTVLRVDARDAVLSVAMGGQLRADGGLTEDASAALTNQHRRLRDSSEREHRTGRAHGVLADLEHSRRVAWVPQGVRYLPVPVAGSPGFEADSAALLEQLERDRREAWRCRR